MMNAVAIAADGGVRVGLEDTIWYDASRSGWLAMRISYGASTGSLRHARGP